MQAILLAAGRGSRLKQLTEARPKPFLYLTVNQRPLIEHTLDHLNDLGITEVLLVVGYLKEYFTDHLGEKYKNLKITYIEVPDWESTNNASGLLYAQKYIQGSFLLLEGDEFFLKPFIEKEKLEDNLNYWIGIQKPITGCLLFPDAQGRVENLEIIRDQAQVDSLSSYYKSCGVLKISQHSSALFFEKLGEFVGSNPENKKKYFDLCLKQNLEIFSLRILPLSEDNIWAEIDSQEDLDQIHNELLVSYSEKKIDKRVRDDYWKNFYIHTSNDDVLYHVSGADKDISSSGYKMKPHVYVHYFYRFLYEEKLLPFLVKKFVLKHGNVLDVACGTGRNSILLSQLFHHVDAFDISKSFIEENKKRFAQYKNISFFTHNVTDIQLPEKKYDLIFLGGICMYLSDDEMKVFLQKVQQALAPGGKIISRDSVSPNATSFYSHIKVYRNEKDYEKLLEQNNFFVQEKYNGPNRNVWCTVFQKLPQKVQESLYMKKVFLFFVKGTIGIDMFLAKRRPFRRHQLTNQLFYILK